MKGQIRQIIATAPDAFRARSMVREYCQARILQFLQESNLFRTWIFHGGTALRFLYALPRYSEDLDFSLAAPGAPPDFLGVIDRVCRSFEAEAYRMNAKIKDVSTVKSAFIRFRGLLNELELSPHADEAFSVKVEIDTNPPQGGVTETTVVRRYVVLNLHHYDKASFLGGKLHAVLSRSYVKGRDLYDLFWYLSDTSWPPPNIPFLNAALRQTGWDGPEITTENWTRVTADRLGRIDWSAAVKDVQPFIERPPDLKLLTLDHISDLLKKRQ
jgi:hypothetical protein